MREAWTDERLDDLNKRVDEGFRVVREDQRRSWLDAKGEIKGLRKEMDARFDKVDAKFDALNARFDAMQRLIIAGLLTFIFGFFVDHL